MNQQNQQNNPLPPFVPVPRFIMDDVREHRMTYGEYEVYLWMRLQTDMVGVATVSIAGLLANLSHFKSEDNLSKFVRLLRSKKYIYYFPRQGVGGFFKVYFGHWMGRDGKMKYLDDFFAREELRSKEVGSSEGKAEVSPNPISHTPKLDTEKNKGFPAQPEHPNTPELRSSYTNTETEKDTKAVEHSTASKEEKPWKKVATRDFDAKDDVQRRCKEIATVVGDPYINYILSVLKKSGGDIEPIEQGFADFKETYRAIERKGERVDKPAALFNRCVEDALANWRHEKDLEK